MDDVFTQFYWGPKSAEGGPNPSADLYRGGSISASGFGPGVTGFYFGRLPRGDFSLWRWDQSGEQKVFP